MTNNDRMSAGKLLRTSALSVLAAAIAMMAVPATASAEQQRGWHSGGGDRSASSQRGRSGGDFRQYRPTNSQQSSSSRGSDSRQYRPRSYESARSSSSRSQQPAARSVPATPSRSVTTNQRGSYGSDRGNRQVSRDQSTARHQSRSSNDWQRNRSYRDDSRNRSYRDNDRNRTYRQADRDRSYRDHSRSDSWRDNRNYRNDRAYRDNDRNRWARNNSYRQWDRHWRNNNRYDWYDYRARNRSVYRLGRYYAPYSGYRYSRIGIGFSLGSLFYSSRYWISDPWEYRLPAVYGPYRWVRYYDDVLLVNIYTGEVVDVIYDFFW